MSDLTPPEEWPSTALERLYTALVEPEVPQVTPETHNHTAPDFIAGKHCKCWDKEDQAVLDRHQSKRILGEK